VTGELPPPVPGVQHLPDLYIIAGMEVPPELAPLDASAGRETARLIMNAGQLPAGCPDQLLAFARSLPQQDRAEPFPPPKKYEHYPPGFEGDLVRMLATRNLNWESSARVLYVLSLSRVGWSAATVGQIGRRRKELTPALLALFAAALGIAPGDLAALAGRPSPPGDAIALNPAADTLAALLWESRRLTDEQVGLLVREAEAMRPD